MAISYFFCEFPNCDVRTHWVLTPECIVTFNHYIRQCTCIAFLLGVKSIFNLWFSKKRSIGKGKRDKRASKRFRGRFGHTPLSTAEDLPWGGQQLIIGTGFDGALPVLPKVRRQAARRGVKLVVVPTSEACRLIESMPREEIRAVLHVTC